METNSNSNEEQIRTGLIDQSNRHFEGINRVVKDTEEDLIDNMPDSHPEPKPNETNTN